MARNIAVTIAIILAVLYIAFQVGLVIFNVVGCDGNSVNSDLDMEEGIVYLTDFSVKYTSDEESPYGEVDESTLAEEKFGTVQSYYYVMQFDMQMANDVDGMEYLTVELMVLDADVVETIINYTNTSTNSVKTVNGQTIITAQYSLPDKAQTLKNVQLIVELKPLTAGTTDIVYNFSSETKDITGYGETDCTYVLTNSAVSISNTSLSYTKNSNEYWVSGIGTKGECKYLYIREYWNNLPVTGIEEKAFYDKTFITDFIIPESVIYIGRNAFTNTGYYNDEANWDNGVLYMNNYLLVAENYSSSSCTVKDGTEVIAAYAFYENSSLEEIDLPDGLVYIDGYAFYKCTSLASLTIPDTVLYIDDYAFAYCSAITELPLSDSLEGIGIYTFYKCTALTSVTLGKNITYIGARVFYDCTALSEINYNAILIEDFTYTGTTIIGMTVYVSPAFGESSGSKSGGIKLTIGSAVTAIPIAMFYECEYITSVEFEENSQCKSIDNRAFCSCTSLASITIPDSVTSIGDQAFMSCTSLTSITIPDGVKSIGDSAFYKCTSLASVTIGNNVTSIGDYAFYNCTKLKSVTFKNKSGWYVAKTDGASSGTSVSVTDTSTNATNLTSTYLKYYWYRSEN